MNETTLLVIIALISYAAALLIATIWTILDHRKEISAKTANKYYDEVIKGMKPYKAK